MPPDSPVEIRSIMSDRVLATARVLHDLGRAMKPSDTACHERGGPVSVQPVLQPLGRLLGARGRKDTMKVAAVVVTYNRLPLLRICLDALLAQSRRIDEILLIDNGSTDGTAEAVRSEYPDVVVFPLGSNTGGAGGFAAGVDIAISRGHDAAWLMDDDGVPAVDALAPLLAVLESAAQPAFAASSVLAPDGVPLVDHAPLSTGRVMIGEVAAIPTDRATFVGVLVNLAVARRTHLPLADFFIWFDDDEYTRRLARMGGGYSVPSSCMTHPRKVRTRDIGDRVYFAIRNSLWICKQPWSKGLRRRYVRDAGSTALAQVLFGKRRSQSIRDVARATRDAVLRTPGHPGVGSFATRAVPLEPATR